MAQRPKTEAMIFSTVKVARKVRRCMSERGFITQVIGREVIIDVPPSATGEWVREKMLSCMAEA